MTGGLATGWGESRGTARGAQRARPGSAVRPWRTLNALSAFAAAVALTASTAATVMQQSSLDDEAGRAAAGGAERSVVGPGAETVVGAYGGAPYTYPSPITIGKEGDSFTIDPVHWYTNPFHNPIYYGARIIRWFSGRTGLMIDFIHSKAIANRDEEAAFSGTLDGKPLPPRARISEIMKKLEFSHGHNMLMLTGLVRLPGIGPRLSPYAGLGGGVLLPHTEVELASHPRTYEYNYAGPTGQALLGLEIRLSRMSLFVEYKFTYAHYEAPLSQLNGSWLGADLWRQLKRWIAGEPPPGGHASTTIASHQVVSGLLVHFVPRAAP